MLRVLGQLLHPIAQLRRVNVQVLRRLHIGHASILDQAHGLKLELSRKLPSLHDPPPAPSKHLTRCLRNRVQASVASLAGADTFTYELNGSLADSGGPSLVSNGGTLGSTGYAFGVNEGLSLRGTRAFDVYSIDIRFYFDNIIGASAAPYQRILDFKNRQSDSGLYS